MRFVYTTYYLVKPGAAVWRCCKNSSSQKFHKIHRKAPSAGKIWD